MINMRKTIILIILSLIFLLFTKEIFAYSYLELRPKEDEASIDLAGVSVPINRIILIRKDTSYCAVRFTKCWTELDEERFKEHAADVALGGAIAEYLRDQSEKKYALYESYYQDDGTGDFTNRNVQINQGKAFWLPPVGPARLLIRQPGDTYVTCGPYKLEWRYKTFVSVVPYKEYPKNYGFEVAPTTWTDIKEVNTKDSRIKWYRFDLKRKKYFVDVNNLWEDINKDRSNDVLIAGDGVEVPLGRILLIRKNLNYCAVKFKKYWTDESKAIHASYESYCPDGGSVDFSSQNSKVKEDSVYILSPQKESSPVKKPKHEQIKCGPIELHWDGNGFVKFFYDNWHMGNNLNQDVELAPTPWKDISEVNINDKRIVWYKNNFNRRNVYIPINKLWEK